MSTWVVVQYKKLYSKFFKLKADEELGLEVSEIEKRKGKQKKNLSLIEKYCCACLVQNDMIYRNSRKNGTKVKVFCGKLLFSEIAKTFIQKSIEVRKESVRKLKFSYFFK